MTSIRNVLICMLAGVAFSACASAQRLSAANDVHALLLSIRDDDQAAFDAHVDRVALKQEIQAKLEEKGAKRYGALAALLAPSIAEFAGDALVQPSVFKAVARQYGYSDSTQIPGPVVIAAALKPLPDGRVCAPREKDGPCVLVFTKEAGVWKLTGFEGDVSDLRLSF